MGCHQCFWRITCLQVKLSVYCIQVIFKSSLLPAEMGWVVNRTKPFGWWCPIFERRYLVKLVKHSCCLRPSFIFCKLSKSISTLKWLIWCCLLRFPANSDIHAQACWCLLNSGFLLASSSCRNLLDGNKDLIGRGEIVSCLNGYIWLVAP